MDWIDEQIAAEHPDLGVVDSCTYVVDNADDVRIDAAALAKLAEQWLHEARTAGDGSTLPVPAWDAGLHFFDPADPEMSAFYILMLDALNFSFWPDDLAGPRWEVPFAGHMVDGYYALAASLTALFGQPDAAALKMGFLPNELPSLANVGVELTRGGHGPVPMLLERTAAFTQLTNGLGRFYSWNSLALIEEAKGSAVRLALLLARTFDSFDDVTTYKSHDVRFFKRAQIAASDLYGAFGGKGPGDFYDMAALTIFADYKLPQVLRHYGVLAYSPPLAETVDNATLIPAGDPREIEIRAATIVACERLRAVLAQAGINTWATQIDWKLWYMGQAAKKEAMRPYHRTRTIFY